MFHATQRRSGAFGVVLAHEATGLNGKCVTAEQGASRTGDACLLPDPAPAGYPSTARISRRSASCPAGSIAVVTHPIIAGSSRAVPSTPCGARPIGAIPNRSTLGGSRRVEADANPRTLSCAHERQRERRSSASRSADHVRSCPAVRRPRPRLRLRRRRPRHQRGGRRDKPRVQDFIQEIGRHRLIRDGTRRTRRLKKPS
jgi:hypothetical protein